MEMKTSREILEIGIEESREEEETMQQSEFFRKKRVSVDSLLNEINHARDNGNIKGEKGFSSALFLSKLIEELENAKQR